jgi:ATP-binding cassette subfamily B protein
MQEMPKPSRPRDDLGNSWQSVRLMLPFFRQYRLQLVIGFLSLLAVNGLQLLIPRIIKHAVDSLEHAGIGHAGLLQGIFATGFFRISCHLTAFFFNAGPQAK